MPVSERRVLVFGCLVVFLAAPVAVGPGFADHDDGPVGDRDGPHLIEPVPDGSLLWPYTSKGETFDRRTLAINLIAYGDHGTVQNRFRDPSVNDWREEPFRTAEPGDDEVDVVPEDVRDVLWREAHGSDRYAYVETTNDEGVWLPESYQIYDGTYLGERYHIRAYESPNRTEEWTAMQAHEEYFDYFRLRHTVTSTETAQRHAEAEFLEDGNASVGQVYHDNFDGSDADGWVTVVEFGTVGLLAGVFGSLGAAGRALGRSGNRLLDPIDRDRIRAGLLAVTVVAVYVGVRLAGIGLEETVRGVSPQLIAGGLYPVVALGLPLAAAAAARPVDIEDAFLVTVVATGAAFGLDYWYLGVGALPLDILLHRIELALSLGLLAAGSALRARGAARSNPLVLYGAVGWLAGLVLPLLGLI